MKHQEGKAERQWYGEKGYKHVEDLNQEKKESYSEYPIMLQCLNFKK